MNASVPTFAANNHSAWEIKYRPVEAKRIEELLSILKGYYVSYADTVEQIEQVDEAEVNSNNFKITGTKKGEPVTYLLRRVPATRTRNDIERTLVLVRLLAERGVAVPKLLKTDVGDALVTQVDSWYFLFVFIESNHYRGTLAEVADAGRLIGTLDRELAHITPDYVHDPTFAFSEAYKKVREFSVPIWEDIFSKATLHAARESDSFGRQLLARREEIMASVRDLEAAPAAKCQLMHFDLHPHNLLADGTRIMVILDFDSVRYVEKMRAVAFALHRLVRQHVVYTRPPNIAPALALAKTAFIKGYRSQNDLSDAELSVVSYFIKHESLSRLSGAMKEYASTGATAWEQDLAKQLNNIAEAAYF